MHILQMTPGQYHSLCRIRDTDPRAYRRERAAALIKIYEGTPAAAVARDGLLRQRKADTIYRWIAAFEEKGIDGLSIRPGRGRKPAFSPSVSRASESQSRSSPRAPKRPSGGPSGSTPEP